MRNNIAKFRNSLSECLVALENKVAGLRADLHSRDNASSSDRVTLPEHRALQMRSAAE